MAIATAHILSGVPHGHRGAGVVAVHRPAVVLALAGGKHWVPRLRGWRAAVRPVGTSCRSTGGGVASPVRASFTRPPLMARSGQAHTSPVRTPQAAAAAREERLSLRRMLARCRCTVCSLNTSYWAMSALLRPCATSFSTSSSRGVRTVTASAAVAASGSLAGAPRAWFDDSDSGFASVTILTLMPMRARFARMIRAVAVQSPLGARRASPCRENRGRALAPGPGQGIAGTRTCAGCPAAQPGCRTLRAGRGGPRRGRAGRSRN